MRPPYVRHRKRIKTDLVRWFARIGVRPCPKDWRCSKTDRYPFWL